MNIVWCHRYRREERWKTERAAETIVARGEAMDIMDSYGHFGQGGLDTDWIGEKTYLRRGKIVACERFIGLASC